MMKRQLTALLLGCALLMGTLTGCVSAGAADLMAGVQAGNVKTSIDVTGPEAATVTDFSVRLLRQAQGEKNTLISPLSVLCALGMTGNGAKGETLAQMEDVFGMDRATLNHYLYAYAKSLPQGDKYKVSLANSIWFRDDGRRLTVSKDFLQANADWYGAGAFKAPFDDGTCKQINRWVKDHTDGMIDGVLEGIPEETVLYLINALAFEAEWESIYNDSQVRERVFTAADGKERTVDFLNSEEYRYLSDGKATGFLKPYADGTYAFAALLPEEGVSVENYVNQLTGTQLHDTLVNANAEKVIVSMPKFETGSAMSLLETLQAMGMTDTFDPETADFSAMGSSTNGPLFIGDVIHKTYIKVDEKGTKAGAVTVVATNDAAASMAEPKRVILDRPFVYMIVDTEAMVPVFLGTMLDVG